MLLQSPVMKCLLLLLPNLVFAKNFTSSSFKETDVVTAVDQFHAGPLLRNTTRPPMHKYDGINKFEPSSIVHGFKPVYSTDAQFVSITTEIPHQRRKPGFSLFKKKKKRPPPKTLQQSPSGEESGESHQQHQSSPIAQFPPQHFSPHGGPPPPGQSTFSRLASMFMRNPQPPPYPFNPQQPNHYHQQPLQWRPPQTQPQPHQQQQQQQQQPQQSQQLQQQSHHQQAQQQGPQQQGPQHSQQNQQQSYTSGPSGPSGPQASGSVSSPSYSRPPFAPVKNSLHRVNLNQYLQRISNMFSRGPNIPGYRPYGQSQQPMYPNYYPHNAYAPSFPTTAAPSPGGAPTAKRKKLRVKKPSASQPTERRHDQYLTGRPRTKEEDKPETMDVSMHTGIRTESRSMLNKRLFNSLEPVFIRMKRDANSGYRMPGIFGMDGGQPFYLDKDPKTGDITYTPNSNSQQKKSIPTSNEVETNGTDENISRKKKPMPIIIHSYSTTKMQGQRRPVNTKFLPKKPTFFYGNRSSTQAPPRLPSFYPKIPSLSDFKNSMGIKSSSTTTTTTTTEPSTTSTATTTTTEEPTTTTTTTESPTTSKKISELTSTYPPGYDPYLPFELLQLQNGYQNNPIEEQATVQEINSDDYISSFLPTGISSAEGTGQPQIANEQQPSYSPPIDGVLAVAPENPINPDSPLQVQDPFFVSGPLVPGSEAPIVTNEIPIAPTASSDPSAVGTGMIASEIPQINDTQYNPFLNPIETATDPDEYYDYDIQPQQPAVGPQFPPFNHYNPQAINPPNSFNSFGQGQGQSWFFNQQQQQQQHGQFFPPWGQYPAPNLPPGQFPNHFMQPGKQPFGPGQFPPLPPIPVPGHPYPGHLIPSTPLSTSQVPEETAPTQSPTTTAATTSAETTTSAQTTPSPSATQEPLPIAVEIIPDSEASEEAPVSVEKPIGPGFTPVQLPELPKRPIGPPMQPPHHNFRPPPPSNFRPPFGPPPPHHFNRVPLPQGKYPPHPPFMPPQRGNGFPFRQPPPVGDLLKNKVQQPEIISTSTIPAVPDQQASEELSVVVKMEEKIADTTTAAPTTPTTTTTTEPPTTTTVPSTTTTTTTKAPVTTTTTTTTTTAAPKTTSKVTKAPKTRGTTTKATTTTVKPKKTTTKATTTTTAPPTTIEVEVTSEDGTSAIPQGDNFADYETYYEDYTDEGPVMYNPFSNAQGQYYQVQEPEPTKNFDKNWDKNITKAPVPPTSKTTPASTKPPQIIEYNEDPEGTEYVVENIPSPTTTKPSTAAVPNRVSFKPSQVDNFFVSAEQVFNQSNEADLSPLVPAKSEPLPNILPQFRPNADVDPKDRLPLFGEEDSKISTLDSANSKLPEGPVEIPQQSLEEYDDEEPTPTVGVATDKTEAQKQETPEKTLNDQEIEGMFPPPPLQHPPQRPSFFSNLPSFFGKRQPPPPPQIMMGFNNESRPWGQYGPPPGQFPGKYQHPPGQYPPPPQNGQYPPPQNGQYPPPPQNGQYSHPPPPNGQYPPHMGPFHAPPQGAFAGQGPSPVGPTNVPNGQGHPPNQGGHQQGHQGPPFPPQGSNMGPYPPQGQNPQGPFPFPAQHNNQGPPPQPQPQNIGQQHHAGPQAQPSQQHLNVLKPPNHPGNNKQGQPPPPPGFQGPPNNQGHFPPPGMIPIQPGQHPPHGHPPGTPFGPIPIPIPANGMFYPQNNKDEENHLKRSGQRPPFDRPGPPPGFFAGPPPPHQAKPAPFPQNPNNQHTKPSAPTAQTTLSISEPTKSVPAPHSPSTKTVVSDLKSSATSSEEVIYVTQEELERLKANGQADEFVEYSDEVDAPAVQEVKNNLPEARSGIVEKPKVPSSKEITIVNPPANLANQYANHQPSPSSPPQSYRPQNPEPSPLPSHSYGPPQNFHPPTPTKQDFSSQFQPKIQPSQPLDYDDLITGPAVDITAGDSGPRDIVVKSSFSHGGERKTSSAEEKAASGWKSAIEKVSLDDSIKFMLPGGGAKAAGSIQWGGFQPMN